METAVYSWNCLARRRRLVKPLTQYGCLAERYWRVFLPRMVAELEAKGQLQAMLLEAEQRTEAELDDLRWHFIQQGLTAQQAQQLAWEIVRARYIVSGKGGAVYAERRELVTSGG